MTPATILTLVLLLTGSPQGMVCPMGASGWSGDIVARVDGRDIRVWDRPARNHPGRALCAEWARMVG